MKSKTEEEGDEKKEEAGGGTRTTVMREPISVQVFKPWFLVAILLAAYSLLKVSWEVSRFLSPNGKLGLALFTVLVFVLVHQQYYSGRSRRVILSVDIFLSFYYVIVLPLEAALTMYESYRAFRTPGLISGLWNGNFGKIRDPSILFYLIGMLFQSIMIRMVEKYRRGPPEMKNARRPSNPDQYGELNCPICYESYDLDTRKPFVIGSCGHTLCGNCKEDVRVCPSCNGVMNNLNNVWKVNYGLMDVLEQRANDARIRCVACNVMELQGRIRFCVTCSENSGFGDDIADSELHHFLFCGSCLWMEEHKGHTHKNYVASKSCALSTEAARVGLESVDGMISLSEDETNNNLQAINLWKREMEKVASIDWDKVVIRQKPLEFADSLREESDKMCEAIDKSFSEMRKLTRQVKDSTDRLKNLLNGNLKTTPENEWTTHTEAW